MVKKVSAWFLNPTWFKLIYFLLVLLSFNSLCALTRGLTLASYAVAILGAAVLLFRLVHFKQYTKTRGILWLVLFCGSYCLSALLTRAYGLTENVQAMVWMVLQFFVVYTYDNAMPIEKDKKEIRIIGWFFLLYTFLMALTAIIMLIVDYNNYREVAETAVISGFMWNRLWGLYTDPNYGAVFSIVSMVLSVMFWKGAKKGVRAFLVVNCVFEFLYITFSDSRTGMVALLVTVAAASYLFGLRWKKIENKSTVFRGTVSVVLALLLALASLGVLKVVQVSGNALKTWQYEQEIENGEYIGTEIPENIIGRTESDINNDVSNRRFAIWQSGLEIFKTRPLFGITFRNYIPYAEQNLPETYIVNNDSGKFASMHNSFVDVLVSQGVLGFILLLCFIASVITVIFRFFFKAKGEDYKYNTFLLLCFLPVFVSMMFYSETFYMNTGGAFLFWSFLGYFMHSLNQAHAKSLFEKTNKE
ncbi:MAG: O-antigen ligase family protein [Candidatus Fimenecus sp.]